jgi:hypothetical protein
MNQTGKYISELLLEHDCVVVPGLGGFVANYAPAQINGSRHIIFPPYKKIVFNRKLKNNDGLLAEYISAVENKSFSEATNSLNLFSENIIHRLNKGETILIESVGSLVMGAENNISFEPNTSTNLLTSSFGFESIQALPVNREEKRVKEIVFENRGAKQVDRKSVFRRVAPYVAVPLLVLLLWLPFATGVVKEDKINFSRINPFYNAPAPIYSPAELYEPFTAPAQYASLFDYEAEGKAVKYSFVENTITDSLATGVIVSLGETLTETNKDASTTLSMTAKKKYHIIAGAFKYSDLAELLVADLRKKGFGAYILDEPNEDLQKVSYEGFPTKNEALQKLNEIQNVNPDAWVYRKD